MKYTYQFVGSTVLRVRKVALTGSPIPSTFSVCVAKKLGGGVSGMGSASEAALANKSDRCLLMVAIKLTNRKAGFNNLQTNRVVIRVGGGGTNLSFCPSHQQGTVMKEIPLDRANSFFTLSRA